MGSPSIPAPPPLPPPPPPPPIVNQVQRASEITNQQAPAKASIGDSSTRRRAGSRLPSLISLDDSSTTTPSILGG